MAATFVVETGAGLTNSNSYCEVSEADSYVENHGGNAAWTAFSEAQKQEKLRLATQYIDLEYGERFRGFRSGIDNALCWPRYDVVDSDGYAVYSDTVPARIKNATIEAALAITAGDDLLGTQTTPGTIKRERKKLGSLEKEVEYVGGKSAAGVKRYPKIEALLRPVMRSSGTFSRG